MIGLVSFPKKIPEWYQSLLNGWSKLGFIIVVAIRIIVKNINKLANFELEFKYNKKLEIAKIKEKNDPNIRTLGGGGNLKVDFLLKWTLLSFWHTMF